MQPLRIGIFCGSSAGADGKYTRAAEALAKRIVAAGWAITYGGGGVGLMGAVARTALAAGGRVIGIRPTFISDVEGDQMGLAELVVTQTMHERVHLIFEQSDAFVALPGSCGTLDEVVQAITWKRLALHDKAIAILNLDGYYDHLAAMFERMVDEAFVSPQYRELYRFCPSVEAVITYLQGYEPPKTRMF